MVLRQAADRATDAGLLAVVGSRNAAAPIVAEQLLTMDDNAVVHRALGTLRGVHRVLHFELTVEIAHGDAVASHVIDRDIAKAPAVAEQGEDQ